MTNSHENNAISSPSSNPLFSTIITLYTLILLYFPSPFRRILLFSASLLLLGTLLIIRLSAATEKKPNSEDFKPSLPLLSRADDDHDYKWVSLDSSNTEGNAKVDPYPVPLYPQANAESSTEQDPEIDPNTTLSTEPIVGSSTERHMEIDPRPDLGLFSVVEWDVGAPLEVIHEECEREEEVGVIERYASLSLYYPVTDEDTGSSSGEDSSVIGNWDLPENMGFRWEEDEDREGLIEIELDGKRTNSEAEEENFIEIDLNFPAR